MNEEKVRCAKCGFLVVKELGNKQEVDTDYRNKGNKILWDETRGYYASPVCLVAENHLPNEISKLIKKGTRCEATVKVLHKSRQCDEFMELIPGLAPKEHLEKVMIKEDREWRERVNQQLANITGKREWQIAIVMGVLVVIGAVIGASISLIPWFLLNNGN